MSKGRFVCEILSAAFMTEAVNRRAGAISRKEAKGAVG
jgi:hypothetical protein